MPNPDGFRWDRVPQSNEEGIFFYSLLGAGGALIGNVVKQRSGWAAFDLRGDVSALVARCETSAEARDALVAAVS